MTATDRKDTIDRRDTATEIRTHEDKGQRAFCELRDCPGWQAERIAQHYIKMAHLAAELRNLVEIRKQHGLHAPATDELIARLVLDIKREHWFDFGIPLEWNL